MQPYDIKNQTKGSGKNQWGEFRNFLVTDEYLKSLGFKKLEKELGNVYAFPKQKGIIIAVTLLEGTRIHLRCIAEGKPVYPGKFNGNCKDENEFLDRLEYLTLL